MSVSARFNNNNNNFVCLFFNSVFFYVYIVYLVYEINDIVNLQRRVILNSFMSTRQF